MAAKQAMTAADKFILHWGVGSVVLLVSVGAALEGQQVAAEQVLADTQKDLRLDSEVCLRLASGSDADWFSRCMVELNWVRGEERHRLAARSEVFP